MAEARIKITEKPTTSSVKASDKVFMNVNGELVQVTVDNVVNNSTLKTTVDNTTKSLEQAINNMANLTEIVNSKANGIVCKSTGSPILLTDSAKGVAIDFNAKGRSTQTQYTGKNLLENTATSQTVGGLTFTVNEDKSIKVSGAVTGANNLQIKNLVLSAGTYVLSGMENVSGGTEMQIRVFGNGAILTYLSAGTASKTFTLSKDTSVQVFVNFNTVGITYSGTIYPMIRLASVTDSTYEPYVGGTASPNPSYPQAIKSVGDMGYFDGELLQGGYGATTGAITVVSNYVCSKNMIPCKGGDKITLAYEGELTAPYIMFYDENKKYLSYASSSEKTLTANAPTNASYFHFNISNNNGITPQTAKHICVTINDMYALIVDSKGKNKVDITRVKGMSGIGTAIDGNTIVVGAYSSVYGVYFDNSDIGLRVGETYIFSVENVNNYNASGQHGFRLAYTDGTFGSISGLELTATIEKEVSTINFYLGAPYTGNLESRIEGLMIRPVGTDDTYEPYKESVKYIPISAPLRGIGEVTDVARLTEGKVDRELNEVTFDGSSDEVITLISSANTNTTLFGITMPIKAYPLYTNCTCSHFVYSTDSEDNEHCRLTGEATPVFAIWISKSRASTIDELRSWLSSNPIKVVYRRAEPTAESIEPIDVDTFEGVTQISVSDNADMEVEYPADTKTYIDNKISETVATLYSAILNA